MASTNCIQVGLAPNGSGGYSGTWTASASGTFSNPVTCDLSGPGAQPGGLNPPTGSSSAFTFGDYQYGQPQCTPPIPVGSGDPRDPFHPAFWLAFSFTISPTTFSSGDTITITMTPL